MARAACSLGSSPHTRGTHLQRAHRQCRVRFIPAYAGNARSGRTGRREQAVHPRIRGERWNSRTKGKHGTGSSPHTRGTHSGDIPEFLFWRFIPAYAGNASDSHLIAMWLPVHPRIRGERGTRLMLLRVKGGSSPHTRGTLVTDTIPDGWRRFIPAYAGNACHHDPSPRCSAVHPRIRGERPIYSAHVVETDGSSPHTRGTRQDTRGLFLAFRFIPAYAGNAFPNPSRRPGKTVHPRIRGERSDTSGNDRALPGSSPHTRGTLGSDGMEVFQSRFIPAYAGNAWRPR